MLRRHYLSNPQIHSEKAKVISRLLRITNLPITHFKYSTLQDLKEFERNWKHKLNMPRKQLKKLPRRGVL